jgi:hypothetical protein
MLKTRLSLAALAAAFILSASAHAQAPAGAPAGSTGTCKDGSYTTNATKSGACSGHKGVATWYGPAAAPKTSAKTAPVAPAPAPAPAPKPAAAPAPAPAPAPTPAANIGSQTKGAGAGKATTPAAAAPGGGPGMVWVNTASKVYHCPTDRYYGKTKAGKYLSESAAQAEGDKPDAGKKCF